MILFQLLFFIFWHFFSIGIVLFRIIVLFRSMTNTKTIVTLCLIGVILAQPNLFDGTGNRVILGSGNKAKGRDNVFEGSFNGVDGSRNSIKGDQNEVEGDSNNVDGSFNDIQGDANEISGDSNWVKGNGNLILGGDNFVQGVGNRVNSLSAEEQREFHEKMKREIM